VFKQNNQDFQGTTAKDTALSPSSRRNCVGNRRNSPNETSVGAAPAGSGRKRASAGAWAKGKRSEAVIDADARMATSRALEDISGQRSL
jgi:hypothetical protein